MAYQSEGFAKHLPITRVVGIDMTADNLSPYDNDWRTFHHVRDFNIIKMSHVNEARMREFLDGLDIVIGAETFYKDEFITIARDMGVRTILQINPEFAGWWNRTGRNDPVPDCLITPTTWRLPYMKGVTHVPFPVDRAEFPFTLRSSANRFTHVAGHRAMGDRAGTRIVLSALNRVTRANIPFTIRSQSPLEFDSPLLRGCTVDARNHPSRNTLYDDTDILVLPRRYGGQSLVMNEALSSGIPVICLDRPPENTWGGTYRIPSRIRGQIRTKGGVIEMWDAQQNALYSAIDQLRNSPDLVTNLSREADEYAQTISWTELQPVYMTLLEVVADGGRPDGSLLR